MSMIIAPNPLIHTKAAVTLLTIKSEQSFHFTASLVYFEVLL